MSSRLAPGMSNLVIPVAGNASLSAWYSGSPVKWTMAGMCRHPALYSAIRVDDKGRLTLPPPMCNYQIVDSDDEEEQLVDGDMLFFALI